jgi:hypothetical protein
VKNPETAFQPSHIQDIDQDVVSCEVTVQPHVHEPLELSDPAIDEDPLPAVLAPADSSAAKLARSLQGPYRVESSRVASHFGFELRPC